MSAIKKLFGETIGRLVFRDGEVTKATQLTSHFRRVDVKAPSLARRQLSPGSKVQLFIDGDLRTYTPFGFDRSSGTMQFLAYCRGGASPGTTWFEQASVGQTLKFFGPRDSISLKNPNDFIVLFGDETSLALAVAFAESRSDLRELSFFFEATDKAEVESVIKHMNLPHARVTQRLPDDSHLAAIEQSMRNHVKPTINVVLSGRARSIQLLRTHLKASHTAFPTSMTKAYWAEGRKGLD